MVGSAAAGGRGAGAAAARGDRRAAAPPPQAPGRRRSAVAAAGAGGRAGGGARGGRGGAVGAARGGGGGIDEAGERERLCLTGARCPPPASGCGRCWYPPRLNSAPGKAQTAGAAACARRACTPPSRRMRGDRRCWLRWLSSPPPRHGAPGARAGGAGAAGRRGGARGRGAARAGIEAPCAHCLRHGDPVTLARDAFLSRRAAQLGQALRAQSEDAAAQLGALRAERQAVLERLQVRCRPLARPLPTVGRRRCRPLGRWWNELFHRRHLPAAVCCQWCWYPARLSARGCRLSGSGSPCLRHCVHGAPMCAMQHSHAGELASLRAQLEGAAGELRAERRARQGAETEAAQRAAAQAEQLRAAMAQVSQQSARPGKLFRRRGCAVPAAATHRDPMTGRCGRR
jgi:hypothetical protein